MSVARHASSRAARADNARPYAAPTSRTENAPNDPRIRIQVVDCREATEPAIYYWEEADSTCLPQAMREALATADNFFDVDLDNMTESDLIQGLENEDDDVDEDAGEDEEGNPTRIGAVIRYINSHTSVDNNYGKKDKLPGKPTNMLCLVSH